MFVWSMASILGALDKPAEPPKPAPVAIAEPPPESLFVSSAMPTVVMVADLASEYAANWMEENGSKLREKGWEVRSLNLEGSDEVRFYIRAQGMWRTHSGHMSLSGLKAMLER